MDRQDITRWILEKLLGSFMISGLLVWGPIFGFNINDYGMGTIYSIITTISLLISIIVYILIPKEFEIVKKIKSIKLPWKKNE